MPVPCPAAELTLHISVRISCGRCFTFGPGKAALLRHIEATGSIREAAAAMAMSYMRAWQIVKSLETTFAEPLVRTSRGGKSGGGATLTDTGRAVLAAYSAIETAATSAAEASARPLRKLLLV